MATFMFVTAVISDRERFIRDYAPAATALIEAHGGRYILRARGGHVLEGAWGEDAAMIVAEWPDRAAAERFWHSPEYAEVKKLREGIADIQVILADGERVG